MKIFHDSYRPMTPEWGLNGFMVQLRNNSSMAWHDSYLILAPDSEIGIDRFKSLHRPDIQPKFDLEGLEVTPNFEFKTVDGAIHALSCDIPSIFNDLKRSYILGSEYDRYRYILILKKIIKCKYLCHR